MTTTEYTVEAHTQGARWPIITGLSSREAADRAVAALVARDGMRAADASGRTIPVTLVVVAAE